MEQKRSHQGRGGDGLYKKRGVWYFRVVDWNGKRRSLSARTTVFAEAQRRRADYLADLERGADLSKCGRKLFCDAAESWTQRKLLDCARNTKRAYEQRVKNINSFIGHLPIREITAETLRRYQIERSRTLSPASVNAETKVIASILRENKVWQRVGSDYHPLREPKTIGRPVTDDEVQRLLRIGATRTERSPILQVIQQFAESGLRHQELKTLQLRDINLDQRCVRIRREGTKTDAGARLIPLTDSAAEAMRGLLARAHRLGAVQPEHYLFPGNDLITVTGRKHRQRVVNPSKPQYTFGDAWRSLRKASGVDPRLRLHDFRHTVATEMAEAGVPASVGMQLMGWTSPTMRRRYEHIRDESLRHEMDRLQAFRKTRKPSGSVIAFPSPQAAVAAFT